MSDSRLEKFIYTICSMDVTDLPVPLSRIEKLWNCLITGETPDFEPLSRNEKYLMAMLDRYDISNLPAPMSRGEKLLYKIAVGETDLSDVPGYLSRYEELLKYLIENGGISGGDFEYVLYTINQSLYTLYTTAEKPVKSAILTGQTMVNLLDAEILKGNKGKIKVLFNVILEDDYFVSNHGNGQFQIVNDDGKSPFEGVFEEGKTYTLIMDVTTTDKTGNGDNIFLELNTTTHTVLNLKFNNANGIIKRAFKATKRATPETKSVFKMGFYDNAITKINRKIMLLEGDYTNVNIPYFEGMQSVKMPVLTTTGKNLFNGGIVQGAVSTDNGVTITTDSAIRSDDYIELIGGETYTISKTKGTKTIAIVIYDENKNFVRPVWDKTFMLNTNEKYIKFADSENDLTNLYQIEKGVNSSSYEPYKSNTLSTPEDLELRGIGNVKDELNVATGELTQRVEEFRCEVKRVAVQGTNMNGNTRFLVELINPCPTFKDVLFNNHNFIYNPNTSFNYGDNGEFYFNRPTEIFLTFNPSKYTADTLKTYLEENPLILIIQLAQESVKTVDLTILNQDNQPTKLGTFENITHVSLESTGLIPEVEMEVATKLLEDTVFNLTNAFNTLYPTAAKPVVDGTLYGQTLVNVATQKSGRFNGTRFLRIPLSYSLKSNTNYFVNFIIKESTLTDGVTCRFKNTSTGITFGALKSSGIITINANVADILEIYIENTDDVANGLDAIIDDIMVIEYQEGMENWDIPYFEGMQSVQAPGIAMTGKNLWNKKNFVNGVIDGESIRVSAGDLNDTIFYYDFKENQQYVFTLTSYSENKKMVFFRYNYTDGTNSGFTNFLSYNGEEKHFISSANKTILYISFVFSNHDNYTLSNVQLEEGSVATSYEPFKSTTLSTPSDLELRKVGEVQDEVNVMTGEVVERVGEFILNGSEYWDIVNNTFRTSIIRDKVIKLETQADRDKIVISCDRYPSRTYNDPWYSSSGNFISLTVGKAIAINDTSFTTVTEWKQYLSQNPLTIKFVLETPTTKTVDLSVVNQDGNKTQLKTFDDTTHVLLNSEGLVPTASLTVRTKIPSASSTSLLMDDISNNQQQLETTVDEQSNNVDATMIATTEIYEETL